jgi:hypothetical protein
MAKPNSIITHMRLHHFSKKLQQLILQEVDRIQMYLVWVQQMINITKKAIKFDINYLFVSRML